MPHKNNNSNRKPSFLVTWSLRGKRGREPINGISFEELQTAHYLLMLSSSSSSDSRDLHKCDICGKTFPSYQALGGHCAGHSRVSKSQKPHEENEAVRVSVDSGEEEKKHKCLICEKVFSSGQALGGHKRLHYERKIGDDGEAAVTDSPTKKKMVKKNKKEKLISAICLDLNLPPLPSLQSSSSDEEEEDEGDEEEQKREDDEEKVELRQQGSSPVSPLMPYSYSS